MLHQRRSIRLKGYDYSQPGAYFITTIIQNRQPILGKITHSEIQLSLEGKIVQRAWLELPRHYNNLELGAYCVMPEHFHGILMIVDDGSRYPLSEFVRAFKSFSARRINALRKTTGLSVWERNYYERIIRDDEELRRTHAYIMANPQNL